MTLPYERKNAVIRADEFLQEIAYGKNWRRQTIQKCAQDILRHFPVRSEIERINWEPDYEKESSK